MYGNRTNSLETSRVTCLEGNLFRYITADGLIRSCCPCGCDYAARHIAGMVAAMTESEPQVESEKSPITCLVDRDSATRRARRLAVQSDVGSFLIVRSREAVPAFNFSLALLVV